MKKRAASASAHSSPVHVTAGTTLKPTCARASPWAARLGVKYDKGLALLDLAQLCINTAPRKGHRRRPRQTLRQATAILERLDAAYDLERARELERTL